MPSAGREARNRIALRDAGEDRDRRSGPGRLGIHLPAIHRSRAGPAGAPNQVQSQRRAISLFPGSRTWPSFYCTSRPLVTASRDILSRQGVRTSGSAGIDPGGGRVYLIAMTIKDVQKSHLAPRSIWIHAEQRVLVNKEGNLDRLVVSPEAYAMLRGVIASARVGKIQSHAQVPFADAAVAAASSATSFAAHAPLTAEFAPSPASVFDQPPFPIN